LHGGIRIWQGAWIRRSIQHVCGGRAMIRFLATALTVIGALGALACGSGDATPVDLPDEVVPKGPACGSPGELQSCGTDEVCCASQLTYACSAKDDCSSLTGSCPTTIYLPSSCSDTSKVCPVLGAPDCTGSIVWLDPAADRTGATGAAVTVVMFSSGWCGACRVLGPSMAQIESEYEKKGVKFIEVLGQDDEYKPADQTFCEGWTSQYGLPHASLIDPCGMVLTLMEGGTGGVIGLPAVVMYDPRGKIVNRMQGVTAPALRSALDGLLRGGG
jgi:thiol-disulfide isomerase/thioredoxin